MVVCNWILVITYGSCQELEAMMLELCGCSSGRAWVMLVLCSSASGSVWNRGSSDSAGA